MIELEARHSHFYPGARGTILTCPEIPADGRSDQPVSIVFSDGAFATATIGPDRDGRQILDVASYVTAAGTTVAPRRWIVAADRLAPGEDFRVLHRAPTVA